MTTKVSQKRRPTTPDVCVVGGAGHIGLPLAIVLARRGMRVLIYDVNEKAIASIQSGRMPFLEHGADHLLKEVLQSDLLHFTTSPEQITGIPNIVVTIGTPVDEFLNPSLSLITRCMDEMLPFLRDNQLIILRSTVSPGVTDAVERYARARGKRLRFAFCPERIVQGHAIEELQTLPQIVSGTTPEAEEKAAQLFALISPEIVRLTPMEAELAKLFTNAYRYVQFAVTNQFYMIASANNVDYYRVVEGMKRNYPRSKDFPRAGLAAGPCLLKDTMQLAAFCRSQFGLGYQAMLVNEGVPQFLIDRIAAAHPLSELTVGLLGMAFKADNDDTRSSLSYKLKKILALRAKEVLTTDPYVSSDPTLLPLEDVVLRSDLLILCAPHAVYKDLDLTGKIVVDIWNYWKQGSQVQETETACSASSLTH